MALPARPRAMPTDNAYSSRSPAAPGTAQKPTARERGQMRRRLRQQRRMREALLLDLGALVFELHRQGRREPELLQAKAAELSAVDQEVRALSTALDSGQTLHELVATGIAGSCANCGSLLSTDARYCSACGAPAVPALAGGRGGGDDASLGPGASLGSAGRLGTAVPAPPEGPAGSPDGEPGAAGAPPAGGALDRIRGRLARRNTDR